MSLTSGAKETRTPDALLANNRQHVHQRPSPQVTVPERVSASLQIRTCCGTFVLYSPPEPTAPPQTLPYSVAVPLARPPSVPLRVSGSRVSRVAAEPAYVPPI